MNDAPRTVPYYINEAKSDMRGIKSGWYAIDEDGNLVFGPFDTYDQMLRERHPANISYVGRSLEKPAGDVFWLLISPDPAWSWNRLASRA